MATNDRQADITVTREGPRTRVRLIFPVQTQAARSAGGKAAAAVFVQTVTVERSGAPVFAAHLGPHMARLPELSFDLEGVAAGEQLRLVWTDNAGGRREQEVTVAP